MQLLKRIRSRQTPTKPDEEFDTVRYRRADDVFGLHHGDEPKRRFIPSKWETLKINR